MLSHLLILAPNWLGDAVMALPAIADVHRASPETTITVAARAAIAPLFGLVQYIADVVVLEKGVGSPFDHSTATTRMVQRSSDPFDTALLLPNSFHSALAVWRAAIPERWGYRTDWRGPLLTRAIRRPPAGLHQVEYYQQLVHALGFPNRPVAPHLEAPAEVRTAGVDALARAGWDGRSPIVGFAPGAAYGGAKRWPAEFFAAVALGLAGDGVTTLMVGGAADAPAVTEIESCLGGRGPILNLVGATDLPALAGLLVNCRALVTNDSGAMHLAAALGVRVVAVFGPTDEHATGPRGEVRFGPGHAVLTHPVWCRPCLLRECPLDHGCMRGVGAATVLAEMRRTA